MLKILLSGACGKMGRTITKLISENKNAEIIAGIDICAENYAGFPIYKTPEEFSGKADVIIDFSHPSALSAIIQYALNSKTPIVVATTGLSSDQVEQVVEAALKIPVFYSANMSIGINLLISLAEKAAAILEDGFDIEIVEKHHNQKIDAPSGTALMLADAVSGVMTVRPQYVYDRSCTRQKRTKNEIGIHSVRGGNIVGDHDVIFAGTDEIIELSHKASSKEVFAVGAVKAAEYIAGKGPGFYNMKNLVNDR